MRNVRSPGAARLRAALLAGLSLGTLGALALGLVAGPLSRPAAAHAELIGSDPAQDELVEEIPDAVEIHLSEAVEITETSLQVYGPDAQPVQDGPPELVDGGTKVRVAIDAGSLEEAHGTYTVDWHVLSGDGHHIDGNFLFSIGGRTQVVEIEKDEDSSADIAGFVGRWLAFTGTVTALGAVALIMASPRERAVHARLRWFVVAGGLVGAIGVGTDLVAHVAATLRQGWFASLGDVPDAFGSRAADYMGLRLLALLLVALVAAALWRKAIGPPLALGLAGTSLASSALVSHAWTSEHRDLAVLSDMVHFAAVSVWIGGLLALLVSLPVARDTAGLARRFSAMAFGAVLVVVPTGIVLGWQHLGAVGNLISTTYGRMLLAKLGLFGILLVFGWLNKTRLVALVERTVTPLSRSLRVESLVAVAVLALTAALVNQPPGRTESGSGGGSGTGEQASAGGSHGSRNGEPFSQVVPADNLPPNNGAVAELQLDVVPGVAGENAMHLHFFGADGMPLNVVNPRAEVSMGEMAPRDVELPQISSSHASVTDVALPIAGTWTVQVSAVAIDLNEQVIFTFEVPIT